MAELPPARELVQAAFEALARLSAWSSETRHGGTLVWEAVVRSSGEFMRWPNESGGGSAVAFVGGVAYLYGPMWHTAMLGHSAAVRAATESALASKWISCDGPRFRRKDRDHSPLGMLLKSVQPDDRATLTVDSVAPTEAGLSVGVQTHLSSGNSAAMMAADPRGVASRDESSRGVVSMGMQDQSARPGPFYEIEVDHAGRALVCRVLDPEGFETMIRYDEHPVTPPVIEASAVLTVEQALGLVRGSRAPRSARKQASAGRRPSPVINLQAPEEADDSWAVTSYDLATALGVANNYKAQEIVQDALAHADPSLLGRLDLDSESGMFVALCDSEEDALTVSALIVALASP